MYLTNGPGERDQTRIEWCQLFSPASLQDMMDAVDVKNWHAIRRDFCVDECGVIRGRVDRKKKVIRRSHVGDPHSESSQR